MDILFVRVTLRVKGYNLFISYHILQFIIVLFLYLSYVIYFKIFNDNRIYVNFGDLNSNLLGYTPYHDVKLNVV